MPSTLWLKVCIVKMKKTCNRLRWEICVHVMGVRTRAEKGKTRWKSTSTVEVNKHAGSLLHRVSSFTTNHWANKLAVEHLKHVYWLMFIYLSIYRRSISHQAHLTHNTVKAMDTHIIGANEIWSKHCCQVVHIHTIVVAMFLNFIQKATGENKGFI